MVILSLNNYSAYSNIVYMRIGRRRDNNSLGGRNILIGMVVVTMVCGALNLLLGGRVEAFTCNDVVNTLGEATGGKIYNPSLYSACALVHPEGQYSQGAMWINSDENSWAATVKLPKDHQVHSLNVFVHGAVLKEMDNKDAYAECIRIYKKSGNTIVENMLSYDNWGYNNSFGSCDDVANVDSSLIPFKGNRVLLRPNNKTPWTSQITHKRSRSVQLDLSTLSSWGATPTVNGGHIVYSNVRLDVFRCWRNKKEEKSDGQIVLGNRGACGASPSTLAIEGNVFYGKSYVWRTEDGKSSGINTGEVYTGDARANTATLVLDNCEEGCKVSFQHELKKTGYNFGHRVSYDVKNETNRTISSEGWNRQLQLGTVMGGNLSPAYGFNVGNNYTRNFPANAFEIVLYPGEIYCSEFNFGLYVAKDANDQSERSSKNAGLRACAKAKGTLATSVSLKINNKEKNVYIKPSDSVSLQVDYVSNPQKAFGLGFRRVELSESETFTQDKWSKKLGAVLSEGGRPGWENRLFVYKNSTKLKDVNYESGTKCSTSIFSVERTQMGDDWRCSLEDKSISGFEVGKSYAFYAKTSNKTPKSIRIGSSGTYLVVRPDIGELESRHVNVVVPYNFKNTTTVKSVGKINNDDSSGVNDGLSLGENEVKYNVNVGVKWNTKVNSEYSTNVPNAQSGIEWCVSANGKGSDADCQEGKRKRVIRSHENGESIQETLMSNNNDGKGYDKYITLNLTDKDVKMGDIVCVWSWLSPENSLGDDNISFDWNRGSNITFSEKPSCKQVGKSPTLQVWGGNVFSEGALSVSGATERKFVYGEGDKTQIHNFGSFGELGVFLGSNLEKEEEKEKNHFASGASLGYKGFKDGEPKPLPSPQPGDDKVYHEKPYLEGWFGGSIGEKVDYGGLTYYSYDGENMVDGEDLAVKLCGNNWLPWDNLQEELNEPKYCYDLDDDISISEKTIGKGQVVVIKTDRGVTINGDLRYRSEDAYTSLSDIPKFIIIARDIDIACTVKQIDGLLIATGTVNTCKAVDESGKDLDKNDKAYSEQLIVSGAIIANTLEAKRTYGAGPGVYSIVPAEIIKFDPSLYDLGIGSTESEPRIVNVTELAPRY